MRLPVTTPTPDAATMWHRYADVLFDRAQALGDDVGLAVGRGVAGDGFGEILLPEAAGHVTADVVSDVLASYASSAGRTLVWTEPPGDAYFDVLGRMPQSRRVGHTLFRLARARPPSDDGPAWPVLPGRAARGLYEQLCGSRVDETDTLAARRAVHLDDPQFDPLILVTAGRPVATAGLQTRGQTGGVFDWFVRPDQRRQGMGGFLLGRVLELAARSQLADVFAATPTDAVNAISLLTREGFVRIADYAVWTTSTAAPTADA